MEEEFISFKSDRVKEWSPGQNQSVVIMGGYWWLNVLFKNQLPTPGTRLMRDVMNKYLT